MAVARPPECPRVPVSVRALFPVLGQPICVACPLPFKDQQAASPGLGRWGSPRVLGKWGWGRGHVQDCATACGSGGPAPSGCPQPGGPLPAALAPSPVTPAGQQGRLEPTGTPSGEAGCAAPAASDPAQATGVPGAKAPDERMRGPAGAGCRAPEGPRGEGDAPPQGRDVPLPASPAMPGPA